MIVCDVMWLLTLTRLDVFGLCVAVLSFAGDDICRRWRYVPLLLLSQRHGVISFRT